MAKKVVQRQNGAKTVIEPGKGITGNVGGKGETAPVTAPKPSSPKPKPATRPAPKTGLTVDKRKGTLLVSGVRTEDETDETTSPGFRVTHMELSTAKSAMVDIVWGNLERSGVMKTVDGNTFEEMQKVCVVSKGHNIFSGKTLTVQEGRIFDAGNGRKGLLPKGRSTRGFYLSSHHRVIEGATVAELATHPAFHDFPDLKEPSVESFQGATPEKPVLLYGTYTIMGDEVPGAVYVVQEYDTQNDIVDGFVWFPSDSPGGWTSEHGSVYGRDLLRQNMGVVSGEHSAPASLADWYSLTDLSTEGMKRMLSG